MTISSLEGNFNSFADFIRFGLPGTQANAWHLITSVQGVHGSVGIVNSDGNDFIDFTHFVPFPVRETVAMVLNKLELVLNKLEVF